jgi:hypothetical protein
MTNPPKLGQRTTRCHGYLVPVRDGPTSRTAVLYDTAWCE